MEIKFSTMVNVFVFSTIFMLIGATNSEWLLGVGQQIIRMGPPAIGHCPIKLVYLASILVSCVIPAILTVVAMIVLDLLITGAKTKLNNWKIRKETLKIENR